LKVNDRVRIEPIVPRRAEQSEWTLESNAGACFVFQNVDSMARIEVAVSFIEEAVTRA